MVSSYGDIMSDDPSIQIPRIPRCLEKHHHDSPGKKSKLWAGRWAIICLVQGKCFWNPRTTWEFLLAPSSDVSPIAWGWLGNKNIDLSRRLSSSMDNTMNFMSQRWNHGPTVRLYYYYLLLVPCTEPCITIVTSTCTVFRSKARLSTGHIRLSPRRTRCHRQKGCAVCRPSADQHPYLVVYNYQLQRMGSKEEAEHPTFPGAKCECQDTVKEILHHLGWSEAYRWCEKPPINSCRISCIHRMSSCVKMW